MGVPRADHLPVSSKGQACDAPQRRRPSRLLVVLAAVLLSTFWLSFDWSWPAREPKTNVIMMISDGCGPASFTFARSFYQAQHNNTSPTARFRFPLDPLLVGSHRSRSTDSLITDSAAGATAFSCALKSYNGAIAVTDDGKPCGTVYEAAKAKGWLTGVVVTSRLTDATPAAFVSHAYSRSLEAEMAVQEIHGPAPGINRTLDLAIGGGGCYFLPKSHPASCRIDDRDLVKEAGENGWSTEVVFDKTLNSRSASKDPLPLLSLLAPSNTPYEIDRLALSEPRPPTLAQLSKRALDLLSSSPSNKKGFIVMIEGSQIDLCAHENDPACHAREIAAYQEAVAVVRTFVDDSRKRGERSVLISTSDHETGGMALGRQLSEAYPNYAYYPSRLLSTTRSAQGLSRWLLEFAYSSPPPSTSAVHSFIRDELLPKGAGFTPASGGRPTDDEVEATARCVGKMEPGAAPHDAHAEVRPRHLRTLQDPPINTADQCRKTLADLMSRRAEIAWSTSGHTGVDINVYAHGYHADRLRIGNMENTEIGDFIVDTLGLDLEAVTKRLVAASAGAR